MAKVINPIGTGGGGGLVPTIRVFAPSGSTITCGTQSYTLGAGETHHDFVVSAEPQRILPEGVQGLESLKTDGSAWIETGINPNGDLRVESKFDYISGLMLYGAYDTNAGTKALGIQPNNSTTQNIFYYGRGFQKPSIDPRGIHEYDINKNIMYVDGVQVAAADYAAFTSQFTMALFAFKNGKSIGWYGVSDCYYWLASKNGVYLRKLYPCRYNEQLGMWDTITNSFYGNSGGGSFTAGAEKEWIDFPKYTVTVGGVSRVVTVEEIALYMVNF